MKKVALLLSVTLALGVSLAACSESPESLLVKRWAESSWEYEKLDAEPQKLKRFDGIRIDAYEGRSVMRHEAEYWEFFDNRRFAVQLTNGKQLHGKWRLKGRGHILALRYDGGGVEVFDVKELTKDELILNFDLGMELRGIARLEFVASESTKAAQVKAKDSLKSELSGGAS